MTEGKLNILVPERTVYDNVHSVTKGILSAIPFAGGLVAELFEIIIEPSYNKRLQNWLNKTAESLAELQQKVEGFNINSLAENEEFISIFIKATQISQRTHLDEKRTLLINATKNSILHPLEFDTTQIYLDIIDRLTIRHIKILQEIFISQQKNDNYDEEELKNNLIEIYFDKDSNLLKLFLKQLTDYHLLSFIQTDLIQANRRIWTIHLSNIGENFLKFIQ